MTFSDTGNVKIRLSKLLSERGICSRREADVYIERGEVLVDGKVVSALGVKVSPDAQISLSPKAQEQQNSKITILLHKPVGYVSTQPEKGYKTAIDLLPPHLRNLNPAGRLDIESKGLLVFTEDGALAKKLIGENSSIEKEYLVRVAGKISEEKLRKLRFGLHLDGKPLKQAKVDQLESQLLRMILHEGKKRQIRRMCECVDLEVIGLKRVRIGRVRLRDLPEGKWRRLLPHEKF